MKEKNSSITNKIIRLILAFVLGGFLACGMGENVFATDYTVIYHDNVVSDMPVDVNSKTMAPSVNISSQTPIRDGFQFNGWCTTLTADGANCSGTQYAIGDTYTLDQVAANNLTLYAMWAPAVEYMQDFSLASCQSKADGTNYTVVDKRDDNDYTVKYINGECWMTQNLRFQGTTLSTTTSNVTSNKTLTYYDLLGTEGSSSSGHCYGTSTPSGAGYSNACKHDSGSTTTGVWYNYYAATAGTVSGTSSSTAATQDICPKNWHLPSGPSTTSNTDFNKLVGNTTSGYQDPTAGLTAFGAVAGGYYSNGSLYGTGYGYWWSATAINATSRYSLSYNSSNGQFNGNTSYYRYYGRFVRCVRSS